MKRHLRSVVSFVFSRLVDNSVLLLACLVPVFGAGQVRADSLTYADLVGTTVDFLNIAESSGTDPLPLFGVPTVADNSLFFDPIEFRSSANDPQGSADITDGQLQVTVAATGDEAILSILIEEIGDYTIIGIPDTFVLAKVSAPVLYRITEIDGVPRAGPSGFMPMVFTPSDGDFDVSTDGNGVGVVWEGELLLEIDGILAANGVSGAATKVLLNWDNILATANEPGSSATIVKKGVSLSVVTSSELHEVPEPTAIVLAALALFGLAAVAWRRPRAA